MKTILKNEIELILKDYKRRMESGDISHNTYRACFNAFNHLTLYWGKLSPKDISKEKWAEFQDEMERLNPGQSQFNLAKYMTVLVRHLQENCFLKQKVQIKDRFARREKDKRRKKKNWVYTEDEIKALKNACQNDKELLQFLLGMQMGFRISDVVQLSWDRIFIEGIKVAYVNFSGSDDKAHFIGRCPVPQTIIDLLMKIPKNSKWIFPQSYNSDKHILTQQINFNSLKKRANVTRGTFHSLRHYRLSQDFKNPKLTVAQVCKMRRVSHQIAMEHYIHLSDEDMALMIAESK